MDNAYEKIVNAMFETLKAVAKMDGDEVDKGQLNYHVVIIGQCSALLASCTILTCTLRGFDREHALFRF